MKYFKKQGVAKISFINYCQNGKSLCQYGNVLYTFIVN
jgi:hypothetical protein